MTDDFLGSLGHLALGSRLKRAGTLIQAATQAWMREKGCEMPGAQMLVLAALDDVGRAPLGTIADLLGIAQPGVSRMVANLKTAGLVGSVPDVADGRVWLLELTADGRRVVEEGKRTWWAVVQQSVADLCDDLDGPLIEQLTALEDKLASGDYARSLEDGLARRKSQHDDAA